MKKVITFGVSALLLAAFATNVYAADWSEATFADGNPSTGKIVSANKNGVTWAQVTAGEPAKIEIYWEDILKNPKDISKVYTVKWKVTYKGLKKLNGSDIAWLGGGAWVCVDNSKTYSISPDSFNSDGKAVWRRNSRTVSDSFTLKKGASFAPEDSIVFMDWSGQDFSDGSVTMTLSDFMVYDKNGKPIAQKQYSKGASKKAIPDPPSKKYTGIYKSGGASYYFENGKVKSGLITYKGDQYYFDPVTYKMYTGGEKKINGSAYYFKSNGKMSKNEHLYGNTYSDIDGQLIAVEEVIEEAPEKTPDLPSPQRIGFVKDSEPDAEWCYHLYFINGDFENESTSSVGKYLKTVKDAGFTYSKNKELSDSGIQDDGGDWTLDVYEVYYHGNFAGVVGIRRTLWKKGGAYADPQAAVKIFYLTE